MTRRPPTWFVFVLGWLVLALAVQLVPACGQSIKAVPLNPDGTACFDGPHVQDNEAPTPRPSKPAPTAADAITETSRTLGWIAGVCTCITALAAVASFFVPTIPARGAWLGLGASLGLGIIRAAFVAYGLATAHVLFWLSVAVAIAAVVFVVVPLAITWRNQLIKRTSDKLAAAGDARASVALAVEAAPSLFPTRETRKAAVAALSP